MSSRTKAAVVDTLPVLAPRLLPAMATPHRSSGAGSPARSPAAGWCSTTARLDGPKVAAGFAPASPHLDSTLLAALVAEAAESIRLTVPGVDADDPERVLAFGRQFDTRPV